jgi:uncharacterized heparinase superfamily protein
MEAMNLLVVERGADWSHWAAASQLLGQAAVILVQQTDESGAAFRQRIVERLQRVKTTAINAVVLLRGKRNRTTTRFLRELTVAANKGLRIFPSRRRRERRARARARLAAAAAAAAAPVTPVVVVS